jgi:radical SAM/Cys-rich protein
LYISFKETLRNYDFRLVPSSLETVQLNIGLRCNKECNHCHVDAGIHRKETMDLETMKKSIDLINGINPKCVDITGGSPELFPYLKELIDILHDKGHKIQIRTNLTVLVENKELIEFFSTRKVRLVASLPCYEAAEVDSIRGNGTFKESIQVLKMINEMGYAKSPDLELNLVYNPEADFLPPNQSELEKIYRKRLREDFNIIFSSLITITNMPLGRFGKKLIETNSLSEYMKLLRDNFNPKTIDNLMCRSQVSINWEGNVYDCDFNLAQNLMMKTPLKNINDPNFDLWSLLKREIATDVHCFGCTAGQGSSCGGALIGS